jgi:hypothetical protein
MQSSYEVFKEGIGENVAIQETSQFGRKIIIGGVAA